VEATLDQIKEFRELTGAGIMDCKKALAQANGNIAKAQEILKAKGVATAAKKASRDAKDGLVDCYIHSGGRVGAIVEINCETDFVARTEQFKQLAHDIAMQVAAMSPLYIDKALIPEGDTAKPQEVALLQQTFIKDSSKTVQDLINEVVAKVGENVRVRRFTRFSIGE